MKKTKKKILSDYERIKKTAKSFYIAENWEKTLQTIKFACGYMYTMNVIQADLELEDLVNEIAGRNLENVQFEQAEKNTVLFYDGFGSLTRGLTPIYLNALVKLGYHVKYTTFASNPHVKGMLTGAFEDIELFFIDGKTFVEQMKSLQSIIVRSSAEAVFLYMNPDDVVAVGAFSVCGEKIKRYMINLTDHAFWLGCNICDTVINFREFGSTICKEKRKIPEMKIAYIPYYPCEIKTEFEGFSFADNSKKLIFSGGALYKTESIDNKYYKLVNDILTIYTDVNFIYLGNGNAKNIKELVNKFPGRVLFSSERKDFFEVMKKCTVYLSTYPYNGGLMTQYALLANKVPVTLSHTGIESELSINSKESFWNFKNYENCLSEIGRLLNEDSYRKAKESKLNKFIICGNQFEKELEHLLLYGKAMRQNHYEEVAFNGFTEIPIENHTGLKYYRLFFRKNGLYMLKFFPVQYILGALGMILEKIYKE